MPHGWSFGWFVILPVNADTPIFQRYEMIFFVPIISNAAAATLKFVTK